MKNRIKKMITITLATVSIIGNVTSAPVQATEYTESVIALYNELSQLNGNSTIKAAILRLCEIINELTE